MDFDSKEEQYFYWWCQDLQKAGIIMHLKYQPKPFQLSSDVHLTYEEQLKTKTKEKKIKLLSGHQYQADFLLYWNRKAKDKIFVDYNDILTESFKKYPIIVNYSEKNDTYFSVIDVKGTFNQNDAWRRFSIDQKWVFKEHNIYVQKIIPHPLVDGKGKMTPANALFPSTFVPQRFTYTDTGKKDRKIRYAKRHYEGYLISVGL